MRHAFKALAVIATLVFCSYSIIADRPKAAANGWMYDAYRLTTDTSFWSGINNKAQITFAKLDSNRHIRWTQNIGISFWKWPVTAGDYRIRMFPRSDDEVMVIAAHQHYTFASKNTNTGVVHVTSKDGKLSFWANDVVMDVRPDNFKSHSGDWDSTGFSFNLAER